MSSAVALGGSREPVLEESRGPGLCGSHGPGGTLHPPYHGTTQTLLIFPSI